MKTVKVDENMQILKNDKYYFTVKCKNFRGSIYPYIIEEIQQMVSLIKLYPPNTELDVKDIMKGMEYEKRYNMIYQYVIEKNMVNDRDKFDFFINRVKSAIKVIASITDMIEIVKEGRGNLFLRVVK